MAPRAADVVLVVEDEPIIRIVAASALKDAGFKVYEAENAAEAVRLLAARKDITALFTDIEMPGPMNGVELASHARAHFCRLEVIVTSGRCTARPETLPRAAQFVVTPYRLDHIVDKLRLAPA